MPFCWTQTDEQQFNVETVCTGGARTGMPHCYLASDFLTPDQGANVFLTIMLTLGSAGLSALLGPAAAAGEAEPAVADVPPFARSQYGRMTNAQRAGALEKSPTCPYCGTSSSTQADHINALKQDWQSGGWADDFDTRTARVNDPNNLIGACQACNASKGARPIGPGADEWWPPGWPAGIWWPFGGP